MEKGSSGVSVRPSQIISLRHSPTPGPIWKPWPQKPKAWKSPSVVALGPMTGIMSGR